MRICCYGASSTTLDKIYYEKAYELGKIIGENGFSYIFGGGETGLMGSSYRGAKEGKAYTIGISPKFFDEPGVLVKDSDEFIFTDTMRERKKLLIEMSDATIVLPGGIGTYEEFFELYVLKSLGQNDRPIVIYNINGYYDKMKEFLLHTVDENFMSKENMDLVVFLDDPDEIINYIKNYKKATK